MIVNHLTVGRISKTAGTVDRPRARSLVINLPQILQCSRASSSLWGSGWPPLSKACRELNSFVLYVYVGRLDFNQPNWKWFPPLKVSSQPHLSITWRLPLFSALLMQRRASAREFIRTMVAVGTFYLQTINMWLLPILETHFLWMQCYVQYYCHGLKRLIGVGNSDSESQFSLRLKCHHQKIDSVFYMPGNYGKMCERICNKKFSFSDLHVWRVHLWFGRDRVRAAAVRKTVRQCALAHENLSHFVFDHINMDIIITSSRTWKMRLFW